MSAQIRSQVTREIREYGSNYGFDFYVYNPHSYFAGTDSDAIAWEYLGHAGLYLPVQDGNFYSFIISPNYLPGQIMYPQMHVGSLKAVSRFYQTHAELFVKLAAVEAEMRDWEAHLQANAEMMEAAEKAEERARVILAD